MSETPSAPQHSVRLVWAFAFVSVLVVTDLLLKLFCSSWPLVAYLVIGGFGAGLGVPLHRRFSAETIVSTFIRKTANVLGLLSAVGLMALFVLPISWDTKCSWRYCGRALGPGLFQSPFPVGTPPCSGWNKCANEYPYSDAQYRTVLHHMRKQDCAAP